MYWKHIVHLYISYCILFHFCSYLGISTMTTLAFDNAAEDFSELKKAIEGLLVNKLARSESRFDFI